MKQPPSLSTIKPRLTMTEALEHNPRNGGQILSIIDLPKGNQLPTTALKTESLIIDFALEVHK